MDGLNDFYEAVADPGQYVRGLKEAGKKIVGYFCSYTPEEIILAGGAHPLRIFSGSGDISLADAHLQAYSCSLVRGALEEALSGRLDYLDGAVFPHTCDSIQRLSDIWRLNTDFGFFADVVLPVKLNTDSARLYMADVLNRFRRELGQWLEVDISDSSLKAAIDTYEGIRGSLNLLYELRARDPGLIRGRDIGTLVKGSMIMDRDYLADRLPRVVEAVKQGDFSWAAGQSKRLLLVGGLCDHPDIYDVLEKSGGVVVADDLCTGSRWIEGPAGGDDPIQGLVGRYMDKPNCAAKHASITARGDRVVELAKEYKVDGVIFLLLKFCDPHAFDYPFMRECLEKENIPHMLYEMEDRLPPVGQLATRFETFIHML